MSLPYDYTSNGLVPNVSSTVNPLFFAWALQSLVIDNSPIIGLYFYNAGQYQLVQTMNASCSLSQSGSQVILTCTGTDSSSATYSFNEAVLLVPQFTVNGSTTSWVMIYGSGNPLSPYTKASNQTVQVTLQLTVSV